MNVYFTESMNVPAKRLCKPLTTNITVHKKMPLHFLHKHCIYITQVSKIMVNPTIITYTIQPCIPLTKCWTIHTVSSSNNLCKFLLTRCEISYWPKILVAIEMPWYSYDLFNQMDAFRIGFFCLFLKWITDWSWNGRTKMEFYLEFRISMPILSIFFWLIQLNFRQLPIKLCIMNTE